MGSLPDFDGTAMISALEAERIEHGLDWTDLAREMWAESAQLNADLADHGLCQGALIRTAKRATMSCQYALVILRWIHRAPEDFLTGPIVDVGDTQLPAAGLDRGLRWDLGEVHTVLNQQRQDRHLTWAQLGEIIGCTPNRLTNLRTARLADMGLTMRVTQWTGKPAAQFIHPARW